MGIQHQHVVCVLMFIITMLDGRQFGENEQLRRTPDRSSPLQVFREYDQSFPSNLSDIRLTMDLQIWQILSIDDKSQVVNSRIRVQLEYYDDRLRWDEKNDENMQDIIVEAKHLWSPSMLLINAAESPVYLTAPIAKVGRMGKISLRQYMLVKTSCNLFLKYFPFDEQNCSFEFDTIKYADKDHPYGIRKVSMKLPKAQFAENSEWQIDKHSFIPPMDDGKVIFYLKIKRRSAFYVTYLIMPSLAITVISFLSFLLPTQGGHQKAMLGVTCMLSMAIFSTTLYGSISIDESALPTLGVYFGLQINNIACITASSIFAVHLHNRGCRSDSKRPSPTLRTISNFLCRFLRQGPEKLLKEHTYSLNYFDSEKGTEINLLDERRKQAPKSPRHQQKNTCAVCDKNMVAKEWEICANVFNFTFFCCNMTFFMIGTISCFSILLLKL